MNEGGERCDSQRWHWGCWHWPAVHRTVTYRVPRERDRERAVDLASLALEALDEIRLGAKFRFHDRFGWQGDVLLIVALGGHADAHQSPLGLDAFDVGHRSLRNLLDRPRIPGGEPRLRVLRVVLRKLETGRDTKREAHVNVARAAFEDVGELDVRA